MCRLVRGEISLLLPGTMPVVFADDVAGGHLAAEAALPGSRFILSESVCTLPELAAQIAAAAGEVLGRQLRLPRVLPEWLARGISVATEALAKVTHRPPLLPAGQLEFLLSGATPVADRARADAGRQDWRALRGPGARPSCAHARLRSSSQRGFGSRRDTMTKTRSPLMLAVCAAALLLSVGVARAANPGDRFDAANVAQIKDLISPGVQWCVEHGMPITIGEYKKIEMPKAYLEATEKFSGQVKLSADGRHVENYVAGLPFPKIDPSDPQVAIKIMWNYDNKPEGTDDVDLRNFDADTGTIGTGGSELSIERHFLLDHLRAISYTGRLYVDPKPTFEPNRDGVRGKQALYPILEPFDLKGVGTLSFRYLDPDKQDDTWLYLPSLRRVRRLSSAQRSDALFGQDTDVDSYYGYAGNPAWMEWKLLGETEMLGVMHAQNFPAKWAAGSANFAFDEVWEKRKVWVVEGTSKLAQYAYSKRVLWIDKESYVVLYSDIYDRAGNLWKVWLNDFTFRKEAFPGAAITYEDEQAFLPAIVMVDIQASHATKATLPSGRFPGEMGWYFNQGGKSGTSPEYFTVASMISAGR